MTKMMMTKTPTMVQTRLLPASAPRSRSVDFIRASLPQAWRPRQPFRSTLPPRPAVHDRHFVAREGREGSLLNGPIDRPAPRRLGVAAARVSRWLPPADLGLRRGWCLIRRQLRCDRAGKQAGLARLICLG